MPWKLRREEAAGRKASLYMIFLESELDGQDMMSEKTWTEQEFWCESVSDPRRGRRMGSNGRRVHLVYCDFSLREREMFEWNV